ncbi:transcriptional regulator [Labrenzia sp. OB1]|nr:transcriptional regulator [Labrenzia sp. OB1]
MLDKSSKSTDQKTDTASEAQTAPCPMPDIAKLIGGKWKLIILQILIFQGTKRFNELRRLCDGVTQTMLTNQLRALEKDGLVERKVYAEVPPRVEYTATQKALDLEEMFKAMHNWWLSHS